MRVLCLALIVLAILPAAPARGEIPVVEIVGDINPVRASHVVRAIEKAGRTGAPLLIIRIDTPGGLMSSTRTVVDEILRSRTPVAVFVGPAGACAASAGFIVAVAADVVAMAPGTHMGAAHPVSALGGERDAILAKKISSDTAADVRGKAERRGRNPEMAEKAVLESRSFTDREALEAKLIDLVVKDVDELVRSLAGRRVRRFDGTEVVLDLAGHQTAAVRMTWRESVLAAVASGEILFLLLLGALAGLGTEISHPGLLFPGIVGTLCLVLFLFAAQIVPVSAAGVLLVVLGVGLFVAEVKVASYGLLTAGGIVAMTLGAMMLVDSSDAELRVPLRTVLPAVLLMALWAGALVRLMIRAQHARVTTGAEGMVGEQAVAAGDLAPEGWVVVRGERWRATAEAAARAGDTVRITAVEGLRLRVRKEES